MSDMPREVLEEVEDCIRTVKAFQEDQGRRIRRAIARTRKGRAGWAALAPFGLQLPADYRALYHNYNGTKAALMPVWEQTVFLEFEWPQLHTVITTNKIMRIEPPVPLADRLDAFGGTNGLRLQLDVGAAHHGEVPLLMTVGTLSRRNYLAFDSTLAMLRSVCAAQKAGVVRYRSERSGAKRRGQVEYDAKEFWDVIRPFNQRAEYWPALIAENVDFEEVALPPPETPGILNLHPEVTRLIVGDPEDYIRQAEKEMRRAGMSEVEIIAARTVPGRLQKE